MSEAPEILTRARALGEGLQARALRCATAESCTGGWIAKAITDVAGSSGWFECGFVTYSNQAKEQLLGVRGETLAAYGAVSRETVIEMAEGALARSPAGIAVAVSGIAGPGGGTPERPVGTVWFAWAGAGRPTRTERCRFPGDREAVRRQGVLHALQGLLDHLG